MRKTRAAFAAVVAVGALAGCAQAEAAPATAPTSATTQSAPGTIDWSKSESGGLADVKESRLEAASSKCGKFAEGGHTAQVSEDRKSISVKWVIGTKTSDTGPTSECVLTALGAPTYVLDHLGATRALDGMQTDEWDGLTARWTFHPDAGANLTVIDSRI